MSGLQASQLRAFQPPLATPWAGFFVLPGLGCSAHPPHPHPVDADPRFPVVTTNAVSRHCPTPSGDLALPQQQRWLTYAPFCLARSCLSVYFVLFAFLLGCHSFSPGSPSRSRDPHVPIVGWEALPCSHLRHFYSVNRKDMVTVFRFARPFPFLMLQETTQTYSLVLSCLHRASEAARQG